MTICNMWTEPQGPTLKEIPHKMAILENDIPCFYLINAVTPDI